MDRKTIIAIAICITSLFAMQIIIPKIFPPIKVPIQPANAVVTATGPVDANVVALVKPPTNATAVIQSPLPLASIDTNAPEQLLVLSNASARYTFTSHGGGLKLIELVQYPESVSPLRKRKATESKALAALNDSAPLPVGALVDDGTAAGNGIYQLTRTATGVRAEKQLANGLAVVKEFVLETNYLVSASLHLENRGEQPLALPARELIVGTATPLGPQDKGQFVSVGWHDGAKHDAGANEGYFANRRFGCLPGTPLTEFRRGESNVVWVSAQNQFFTLASMPEKPALQMTARPVQLPRETGTPAEVANPKGYQAALVYPAVVLKPGEAVEEKLHLFAGPKEYRTLARIADRFKNDLDEIMGYSGFFGGFARVLLLAMNWIHNFGIPYGWAIIAITVIIKFVFWPLTRASTRSMKRMQHFQPQMKAIQEKYKDDPAKMNKKTMEFMKEHKINPVGGCLPMLIQLPIFIGFYQMIQSAIELRGAPFLWIGDLSNPDTLFVIPGLGVVPFIGIPGVGLPFNLLPIIMGATQIWQIKLTPPSPGMDPAQQKIMKYMPLMFIVILYNFSAGLTLYWTAQNLLTILQTKLTKDAPEVTIIPSSAAKKK